MGERQGDDEALLRVSSAVTEAASCVFPDLGPGRPDVAVGWHRPRARCSLTRLDLSWGQQRRSVLVKIRSSAAEPRAGELEGRPRPIRAPDLAPAGAAALEYAGLQALERAVAASGDRRFGVVRPLLLLPEHAAIVLGFVTLPTLRQELMRGSRLHRRRARLVRDPWENAGALLALYHRSQSSDGAGAQLTRRSELSRLLSDLLGYLGSRDAPARLLRAVELRADELLRELPEVLPSGVGHGDFSARNLFVDPDGRVSLFDPMPRWQTPVADDLASFIVGMRLSGHQLATRGAAFGAADLERREAALLSGYGLSADDPGLRLLVLVALLDRWSWLASRPSAAGLRRHASAVRAAWLRQEVYREARRLVAVDRPAATPR